MTFKTHPISYRKYFWDKFEDESDDVEGRPGDEKGDCTQVQDQVCPVAIGKIKSYSYTNA